MIRKIFLALMATMVLFVGVSVVNPPPASAGNCSAPGLCGKIENHGSTPFQIRRNYGDASQQRWLYQWQHSTWWWADTDQWYLPAFKDAKVCFGNQCWMLRNTGWVKITDNYNEYDITLVPDGYQLPYN